MTICDLQQKNIFLTARKCVGRPFCHQGRDPKKGLDCVGLIIYVAKAMNLKIIDSRDYKKIPEKEAISRQAKAAGFIQRADNKREFGDVVILKFGRYLEHAAIVSDRGIIHACEKYGKVVEHRLDEEWLARISAVYRFPIFSNTYEGTI